MTADDPKLDPPGPDRAEQALRDALAGLRPPPAPDPAGIRSAVRRRQRATAGVLTALVLLALAGGVASWQARSPGTSTVLARPSPQAESGGPGPSGWRTEHYRDIAFEVPADWGYAIPPQADWCVDTPDGQPDEARRAPYVWLGGDLIVDDIACPAMPDSLLTEHAVAIAPGPAVDYAEGEHQVGDWWVVTRFAGSAVLVVTSQDQARARAIVESAQPVRRRRPVPGGQSGRRCARHPAAGHGRADRVRSRPAAGGLSVRPGRRPGRRDPAPAEGGAGRVGPPGAGGGRCPGRRATPGGALLTGSAEQGTRGGLAGEDRRRQLARTSCTWPPAVVLRDPAVRAGSSTAPLCVTLTRDACQALIRPPLWLGAASGDVAESCLG